jgi:hypothetical protein
MASLSDLQVEMFDTPVRVSADGSMAWARFTSELRYHYQGENHVEQRLDTLVLEKVGDRWLIVRWLYVPQPPK